MDYFTHLTVLLIGVIVLMVGIVFDRSPGQSFRGAFYDSVVWGAVYFVSFWLEFLLITNE